MSDNKWMPGMLLRPILAREQGDYRVIAVDELFADGEHYTALTCIRLISGMYVEEPKVETRMFYPLSQQLEPVKSDFATALCLAELRARTWEPGISH